MPRITIISQWYPPEQAPFGHMMQELATGLANKGWKVTVVTGFPNHPTGVLHRGYQRKWLDESDADGVRLCRVWLALSRKRTRIGRVVSFLSFTLLASWRVLRQPRPDVIFAVLQPLSFGMVLPIIARLKHAKLVFNVQDLHPEAQIRAGLVSSRMLIGLLSAAERFAYSNCSSLIVICEQFRHHVAAHGAAANRISVVGNWIDTDRIRPNQASGIAFRRELGIADGDFVVLWAGTLGHASGAAVVIDAAERLSDQPRIRFLVVGEGPDLESLKERTKALALQNVVFLPFQDETKLLAVQNSSDLSLVTLAPDFAEVSVPSKLLAYLAAGRAVVASIPHTCETANIIRRAACGVIVPAANGTALAEAIRSLAKDAACTSRLGANARQYAVDHLSRSAAIARYELILATAVSRT